MTLAIVHSCANSGIKPIAVTVEIHLSNGLPGLSIVGLPETAVKESKDRVRSALINANYEFPARRITVNLAPADLPKEGGRFDLPIALGILVASGQIPQEALASYEFIGELALSGELRPIQGALPSAMAAKSRQRNIILPLVNATEASLASDIKVYGAQHLLEVCAHLSAQSPLAAYHLPEALVEQPVYSDLADVQGQPYAKRALEIAAAGNHSMLMFGPPGSGKTMLASRLPSILPPLTEEQAIEVAALLSISGKPIDLSTWFCPPFRAPHHTISSAALVGGSNPPRPGEISLAHNGVLFLDELPEFSRQVLETLREPLESGQIHISRSGRQTTFPAKFQLIAAMNPCPCGYLGSKNRGCYCSTEQIRRYRNKISGPLLDRIDLHLEVPALPQGILLTPHQRSGESSTIIKARVIEARQRQLQRNGKLNASLTSTELVEQIILNATDKKLLENAITKLNLSARAYFRVLRTARTIADLADSDTVESLHLGEALTYRITEANDSVSPAFLQPALT